MALPFWLLAARALYLSRSSLLSQAPSQSVCRSFDDFLLLLLVVVRTSTLSFRKVAHLLHCICVRA